METRLSILYETVYFQNYKRHEVDQGHSRKLL